MILAVLQTPHAFGAVPEIQVWIIGLCSAADSALVDSPSLGHDLHLGLKVPLSLDLLWAVPLIVAGHGHKEDHIEQGQRDLAPGAGAPSKKTVGIHCRLGYGQPFGLDGDDHEQQKLYIRKTYGKCQEYGKI